MKKTKNGYSRRDFIFKTVGGAAAVGIMGKTGLKLAAADAKSAQPPKGTGAAAQPITRVLGKTGIRVPVVSMGVMNADNPALVKRSFEMGIRHFDTASGYQKGRNEEMVGNVIKELKARDQVVIATKIPPARPEIMDQMGDKLVEEDFLSRLDQSLARLQTDHVDILYMHNISDPAMLKRPGLLAAIDKAKKTKKARFVGFSTHKGMAECLEAAAPTGRFDVILTAVNYSMADDKALLDAMKKAAAAGIGLVAMKTQCRQAWSKESSLAGGEEYREGSVWQTALLKWALRLESVTTAIPGYTTFQQLESDWPVALNLDFTPDENKFLADPGVKLALGGVCRQCGSCAGTCPAGVDVPALVRAHMYAADYGNFSEMRRALAELPAARGLHNCLDCGKCQATCVRGVRIARRLEELKAIFA
jgi:predicted aldo/keto reductase-like oxidoreductase